MIFVYLKLQIDVSDEKFNKIYPESVRKLAQRHWTPVSVAKKVAEFLVQEEGTKVLDIGSGSGKFCMVGAAHTYGHFTGVEQRENLYKLSEQLLKRHHLSNVNFIHSNITKIKFEDYNAFYFFNSFFENIDSTAIVDQSVNTGAHLYALYTQYVFEQLEKMPSGTRLVTYWSDIKEVPSQYNLLFSDFETRLKFWQKG